MQDEHEKEFLEFIPPRHVFAPRWLVEMPYWAASALLHLIFFALLLQIVSREPKTQEQETALEVRPPPPPPPEYDPTLKRDVVRRERILDEKKVEEPIIRRKRDEVTPNIPKGTSLDNLSNLELNALAFHDAIGLGGGASGAYGERWGKGSLTREGGSEGSEEAVRAALEWLARHQNPDGSWSAHDFTQRCRKTCTNENPQRYGDGRGAPDFDVGVTALAILAFSGYGQTHQFGAYAKYVAAVRKAVSFLKSAQVRSPNPDENGRYGKTLHRKWIYDHAIATMAMAELLAMTHDLIGLRRSVRSATELCFRTQNPGLGWRYGVRPGDNDTSVTGWMVLALKTAKYANVGIPTEELDRSLEGALRFFRDATSSDGRTGYTSAGGRDNRSRGWPNPYPFSLEHSCMTSVSVICRIFAGESRSTPDIRKGVDILLAELPEWRESGKKGPSTINLYYWYYGSYALFQYGGQPWTVWNEAMQKAILESQRRGGCEDGSWDTVGEWSNQAGRVYSTAIGAMTLEVYYRFRRIQEGISF